MTASIDIVSTEMVKDDEGFVRRKDVVVASVRAYKEDLHPNIKWERWLNMAPFTDARVMFRFRVIPGLTVTTAHVIVCAGERYRILRSEDVRGRGMYIEVLGAELTPTVR